MTILNKADVDFLTLNKGADGMSAFLHRRQSVPVLKFSMVDRVSFSFSAKQPAFSVFHCFPTGIPRNI